MFKTHRTKDGVEMLICQMGDKHLLNTIKLICQQMSEQRNIMLGEYEAVDPMIAMFTNQATEQSQREAAKAKVRVFHDLLVHYVIEAVLRDFDVSEYVVEAYGRYRKTTAPRSKPLLLDGANDQDDQDTPF